MVPLIFELWTAKHNDTMLCCALGLPTKQLYKLGPMACYRKRQGQGRGSQQPKGWLAEARVPLKSASLRKARNQNQDRPEKAKKRAKKVSFGQSKKI